MFGSGVGSGAGQEIWIWAFAESIRFKPLRAVIEERRRLFVQIIFGVLRELELARDMRESELVKLALECDAYITGLYVQLATGARPMDHAVAELTLLSMTIGRAATKAVLQRPAAARASKRPATRRSKAI